MTGQPVYPAAPDNGLAVASFVVGIFGVFPLALIFGHMASRQARREGRPRPGLATAGLVLGYLVLVPLAMLVLVLIVGGIVGAANQS